MSLYAPTRLATVVCFTASGGFLFAAFYNAFLSEPISFVWSGLFFITSILTCSVFGAREDAKAKIKQRCKKVWDNWEGDETGLAKSGRCRIQSKLGKGQEMMMSRTTWTYWIETRLPTGSWFRVVGSQGNRSYAEGWLHALQSFYPRPPYRWMRRHLDTGDVEILEFSEGVNAPTTNSGGMRAQ